jgi:hypothetical protein
MNDSEGSPIPIPESHLNCILDVIAAAWMEKTKETYGTGLLTFHVYCDIHKIPDAQRAPISQSLLAAFIASCAGAYSGSAISNYTAGLRAWYLLHDISWATNVDEMRSIIEGASRLAPTSSSRQKRIPFERDILLKFLTYLDTSTPHDAAIFACLVITFFTVSRLGEFVTVLRPYWDHSFLTSSLTSFSSIRRRHSPRCASPFDVSKLIWVYTVVHAMLLPCLGSPANAVRLFPSW